MLDERNKILGLLYCNDKINQTLSKLDPADLRDDAKQELFLILASMPYDKFMHIHRSSNKTNESGLIWWSIRTLCNMMKSGRSTFARTYRKTLTELNESHDPVVNIESDELSPEEIYAILKDEMSALHWYERTAFDEYVKVGSALQLSRETGIPYRSIFTTIKQAKRKLREGITAKINLQTAK